MLEKGQTGGSLSLIPLMSEAKFSLALPSRASTVLAAPENATELNSES